MNRKERGNVKEDRVNASAHPTHHGPAPALLLQLLEVRAIWEHYATLAMRLGWSMAAIGDGHPVLVLPGLCIGDAGTALLRRFLISRGYAASGWGQGLNLGLTEGVLERAHDRLRQLYAEHGRTVSLIGWSLGGLYARELAKHSPEMVRLCISLGSPFAGHPRETNVWRLYEFVSGHPVDWHDSHGPLRAAPPVPTTSIWSPTDGVVAWRSSVETRRILSENVVIDSSHLGLCAHPAALYAIADRLAQPEGQWEPFHRDGWRRLVYRDPKKLQTEREAAAHPGRRSTSGLGDPQLLLVDLADRRQRQLPQRRSSFPGQRSGDDAALDVGGDVRGGCRSRQSCRNARRGARSAQRPLASPHVLDRNEAAARCSRDRSTR